MTYKTSFFSKLQSKPELIRSNVNNIIMTWTMVWSHFYPLLTWWKSTALSQSVLTAVIKFTLGWAKDLFPVCRLDVQKTALKIESFSRTCYFFMPFLAPPHWLHIVFKIVGIIIKAKRGLASNWITESCTPTEPGHSLRSSGVWVCWVLD